MHDHTAHAGASPRGSRRVRVLLAAVLIPVVLAVAASVLWLAHGPSSRASLPLGLGPGSDLVHARVLTTSPEPCPSADTPSTSQQEQCLTARVRLTTGPHAGRHVSFTTVSTVQRPFPRSGGVVLSYDPAAADGDYSFTDVERSRPLGLLVLLFAGAVALVARWTGVRAFLGLGASLAVLLGFVIPALLAGRPALLVGLSGSAAVLLVVMFLAHGIIVQTETAVLGTLVSLLLATGLAQLFVSAASLSGTGTEETDLLASTVHVDVRGLLLAGVIVGTLGALIDMTVTQSSAVWQLHLANPSASRRALYTSAMAIGRDHVAAATTTLVLAYAGTALPLMLVYELARISTGDALTNEVVASEIVRTLVGTVGLVAAVPLTTALAALTVGADDQARTGKGKHGRA